MKNNIIFAIIVTVAVPVLIISFLNKFNIPRNKMADAYENMINQDQSETENQFDITVLGDNDVKTLKLEDYIVGVVLGEMPAEFDINALMAQAIVARTYTCKSLNHSKHEISAVCTDSACCQAYMSPETYLQLGGSSEMLDKVFQAVITTQGQVLTYHGELIEATYFSCSGGRTEAAYAVWGSDVPYLQAVDSPGEEKAAHFTDTVNFSVKEFCEKLEMPYYGTTGVCVENIVYTEGGGVSSLTLNGYTFSGTEIRKLLNLRSTAFIISAVGDTITVTTKGFGHRVGMSQYGAEAMAIQGRTYKEILQHYYPGTELSSCYVDNDS